MSSDSNTQLFFVKISIIVGERAGLDLIDTIKKISKILQTNSAGTKCLCRFKVVGETTIIAAYEVTDVNGLEGVLNDVTMLGSTEITCDPVVAYESFSERIGVSKDLTGPSPHDIATAEQCIWAVFTVEYPGKTMEELLTTWKMEATVAMSVRQAGAKLELFKVCGQRKVHLIIADTAEGWDEKTFKLPLMTQNGDNVKIVTKSLLNLDTYMSNK